MTKKIAHNDKKFEDTIYNTKFKELIETQKFKRLKNISFLGAVDPWLKDQEKEDRKPVLASNRFNHSIGVYTVALEIIKRDAEFPKEERDLFLLAALLHDLGHGPLSHSVESVFERRFGINHHKKTNEMICDEAGEIRQVIRSFRLHETDVTSALNGTSRCYFKKYFQGHFNVDTLDGIYRCYSLFNKVPEYSLDTTIDAILLNHDLYKNEKVLDSFWKMKGWVYNLILYNGYGRIADEIALRLVEDRIDSIRPEDFEKTDRSFYIAFPELKIEIIEGVGSAISGNYLFHMEKTRARSFEIKKKCRLDCIENINFRYSQKKGDWVALEQYQEKKQLEDSDSLQYGLF